MFQEGEGGFFDRYGRTVNYLRISVTDRCNLRCRYCVCENQSFIPHADILRYEELQALLARTSRLGVGKVRFTGGEPFVRRGFTDFVEQVLKENPGLDLRITTNATLLEPHVDRLARAGVKRVNISLDTLDRERFQHITGRDFYHRVRSSIDACLEAGIGVKINAVAERAANGDQIPGFLELIRNHPVDVRFIEVMPIGGSDQTDLNCWSAREIVAEMRKHASLTPILRKDEQDSGPARMYLVDGAKGRFGLITPVSSHYCDTCNRLRITSDGRLRTCLYSDRHYDLREILRHPKLGPDHAVRVIRAAQEHKPLGYHLLREMKKGDAVCRTAMATIGG